MTSENGNGSNNDQGNSVGSTNGYQNVNGSSHVENYDASKPGKNDVVFYEGTWWRHVCGTGWVEQDFDEDKQRTRDKGLPVGPSDSTTVKGFGKSVDVTSQRYELRNRIGDVYQRGVSYGPSDNQEGPYKIDCSGVVAYWNTKDKMWYAVKWNPKDQKFTKADNIAPEGQPLKKGLKVRKWQDGITVSHVDVDQEFYDGNTWWVKQNGQLVEQEWNERNNQFRPKNIGPRGPSGKLVVGRFDKEVQVIKLQSIGYQDPHTGEFTYSVEDRPYMDLKTGVVYYHATNGVGQKWWWYAKWDGGIGKFNASWSISYGPNSDTVLEWVPSTGGPFDVDDAKENQIVWYNNSFWKKMLGVWVQHTWDEKNSKIVIKKETTVPTGALIAPVGDAPVNVFEKVLYSRSAVQEKGNASKGAYKMVGGDNPGKVYWWDGKMWTAATWSRMGIFEPGTKKEEPNGFLQKWDYGLMLCDVPDGQELWYMGTVWKKMGTDLIYCGGKKLPNEKYDIKAPIGSNVNVKKATCDWQIH